MQSLQSSEIKAPLNPKVLESRKEKTAQDLQLQTLKDYNQKPIENLNQNKCSTLPIMHGRNASATSVWLHVVQM